MVPAAILAAVLGLSFLFCFNPQHIEWFPRCPFLALTGYQCPGCGTLRGIHSLLHLRFADAWSYNPLMIVSLPLLVGLLLSQRMREKVWLSRTIAAVVITYWILRNII